MKLDALDPITELSGARYEVQPLQVVRRRQLITVGHSVRLYAAHAENLAVLAGSARCQGLWRALRALGLRSLEAMQRTPFSMQGRARWAILPFDRCLHLHHNGRREIELTIEIRIGEALELAPVTAEGEAVARLCDELDRLGAQRRP